MDPAAVALFAAGIPAFVAAATFAVTQILTTRSAARDRVVNGLLVVVDALEDVPLNLTRPRIVAFFRQPDLPLAFACTRLVLVLPKRDRIVWQWLTLRAEEVANTRGVARATLDALGSDENGNVALKLKPDEDIGHETLYTLAAAGMLSAWIVAELTSSVGSRASVRS